MENRRSKKALLLVLAALCAILALTLVACNTTTIQKIKFKVTFDVDGVSYYEINTQGTEVLQMPADPTKEGFIFDGWFWDKDTWTRPFTANSLSNEALSADMRVYAKWKEEDIQNTPIQGTGLRAKTLIVDGTNLYTKVSNATETFSFINEISVADGAKFTVHTDISCSDVSELKSKTTSLETGDNVLYILVSYGNDVELYTATIRRRPIYSVTFNYGEYRSVLVEEDALVEEPEEMTRKGYTFEGWDFDFSTPIVRNTTITAKWKANTYHITYVLNGGENASTNVTTYTTDDGLIKFDDAIGDELFCGWYEDETFDTYCGQIYATEARDITLYALFDGTIGLEFYKGSVGRYTGDSKDIIIPSKYKGFNVTDIYNSAFFDCKWLTSVTIGDSVTSIGDDAFAYCKWLTSVTIGDSVASIGSEAFSWCYRLVEVYNKSSLNITVGSSDYGYVAYYAKNVYMSDGRSKLTTTNDGFILYDKTTLVNYIGDVTDITIPDSVASIDSNAFRVCSGLTSVIIPDSVMSIGYKAFNECRGLTSVTIGNSVTSIGDDAFSGCSSLTSMTIPNKVTSIGSYAFEGCEGLMSVTIGSGVTSIGNGAFQYCRGLTRRVSPDSVTNIDSYVFYGCNKLTSLYYNGTVDDWANISISRGNDYLTNATRYYYSEEEPTDDGNYWHYVNGAVTVLAKEN